MRINDSELSRRAQAVVTAALGRSPNLTERRIRAQLRRVHATEVRISTAERGTMFRVHWRSAEGGKIEMDYIPISLQPTLTLEGGRLSVQYLPRAIRTEGDQVAAMELLAALSSNTKHVRLSEALFLPPVPPWVSGGASWITGDEYSRQSSKYGKLRPATVR